MKNLWHFLDNNMFSYLYKWANQDKHVGRFFIATDSGPQPWSHMTVKFLGNLTQNQLNEVKNKMDNIASQTSKFEIRSEGLGLLGRKKPNLVDFIQPTDKVKNIFKKFKNKNQVPHITRVYGRPGKHGPFKPVDEELVTQIHLYKSDGFQDYKQVYSVDLQRRSPWQWIKDQFNW